MKELNANDLDQVSGGGESANTWYVEKYCKKCKRNVKITGHGNEPLVCSTPGCGATGKENFEDPKVIY